MTTPPLIPLRTRLRTACLVLLCSLSFLGLSHRAHAQQYCTTNLGGFDYAWIDSVSIVGTTLQSPSGAAGSANGYYNLFPASGNTTATLLLGTTYTIYLRFNTSSSTSANAISSMWIDYNHDFTFAASEWVQVSTNAITATASFTVPVTALPGSTRMRIRSRGQGNPNGSGDACSNFGSGETEDYVINIASPTPCSGTPVAGTTTASPASPCSGSTTLLSLSGASISSGLTYRWERWNTATNAWDSVGAGITYTTPAITSQQIYRALVRCTNAGGGQAYSIPDTINVLGTVFPYVEDFESITSPNTLPQCMAATNLASSVYTYTAPTGGNNQINHTLPTGSKFLSFRWGSTNWVFTPGLNLTANTTYRFSYWYITDGLSGWTSQTAAVGTAQNANGMTTTLGTVSSPTNTTYQQVSYTFTPTTTNTYYFGLQSIATSSPNYLTIDDIRVDILPPCSGTPTVTVSPSDSLVICPTASFTLTGNAGSFTGLTYQWDSSLSATGPFFNIPGATNAVYNSSASGGDVFYRLKVTCANGSASTTSSVIKVKVANPTPANIPYVTSFESWNNYCATADVPGGNWKQGNAATGNGSWRRNDQGNTAGWTNATSGSYTPAAQHGTYSARYHSYSAGAYMPQYGYDEGQLDLYLNMSGLTAPAGLYFYHRNTYSTLNDSLVVLYSSNGGLSFQPLAGWDTAANWTKRAVNIPGGAAVSVIRFAARKWGAYDYSDIGIDSVYVAPPCSGTPVAGNVTPSAGITACPGSQYSFSLTGTSMAGNLNVQWETSTTSATTGFVNAAGSGATGYNFTTAPILTTTWVRAKVTCGTTGTPAYSNAVAITVSAAVVPATLPYTEDFESWISRCSTSDIPSAAWTNIPATGNASWRREDQGSTAAWSDTTQGRWYPAVPRSVNQNHAARFHNYYASPDGSYGTMDLYVDASGAGTKELQYYAGVHSQNQTYITDSLTVAYSPNGGANWIGLNTINNTTGWQLFTHALPAASTANTIIRFRAYSYTYSNDMSLDYVRVLPACTGKPTAGTVTPATPCANTLFDLKLTGTSAQAGLTYQWQYVNAGSSTTPPAASSAAWTNGGTTMVWSSSIAAPRWVRAIVTCSNSTQRDTSAPVLINLAPFSQCYCASSPLYPGPSCVSCYQTNIGNVTLKSQPSGTTILNNGNATPLLGNTSASNSYSSFVNLTPTPLYQDSTYRAFVQQINYYTYPYNSAVSIWIDYDQNGVFDHPSERVFNGSTSNATVPNYLAQGNFTIPTTAKAGVTGMRVALADNYGSITAPVPCGAYNSYGETEDYLVEIRFPPCSGQANPGIAVASDDSICAGYPITLIDTTYEKQRYGLVRQWQQSTDGGQSWQNVGPVNRDTLQPIVLSATQYRLRVRCSITGDSSFSSIASVALNPPTACYCVSYATGGANRDKDSSDIGAFSIGKPVSTGSVTPTYSFVTGGPHLLNPAAVKSYTNYTKELPTIELWADSTYQFEMYHIMNGNTHRDAKVTLFMDFNNNQQYEAAPGNGYPSERMIGDKQSDPGQNRSGAGSWYKTWLLTIPSQQIITDVPTGMRLIINENTAANIPSDEGCGVYDAGETEDYQVIFRKVGGTQGVGGMASLKTLGLYPNPTNGKTSLNYTADKAIKELTVTVTNMTGQVMSQQSFNAPGKQFSTELDLSTSPRGVYFVELRADGEKAVRKLVVR